MPTNDAAMNNPPKKRGRPPKDKTAESQTPKRIGRPPKNKPTDGELITEAVKKVKHKRPGRTEEMIPHCPPGEMAQMIQQAVKLSAFGDVDTNDGKAVWTRIIEYFDYCVQQDIRPSAEGMALSLNTTRTTLWRWREGVESNKPESVRSAIKKGYAILNYLLAQWMQNGNINPVSAIFLLKNNYQYTDKSEVIVTPNTAFQSFDAETARQHILESLPEDTTDYTADYPTDCPTE